MSEPKEHLDIVEKNLGDADNEMKLMAEHGHNSDDRILKGILGMKLIASKVKELISREKGDSQ